MFYEVLRLWEDHLYVFYLSGRLSGGSVSNDASGEGGSAKERPSCAWGRGRRRGELGSLRAQVTWDHMSSSGHHGCEWIQALHFYHARPAMGRRIIIIIIIIIIIVIIIIIIIMVIRRPIAGRAC